MNFQVLTLFPQLIESVLSEGVVGQAFKRKMLGLDLINPRNFAEDIHRSVDDRPYGGGDGMVMLPQVLSTALMARPCHADHVIYMSPQGQTLNEKKVSELSQQKCLTVICGRYAGVDQRFINQYVDEEISLGDFVLSGGELAALCLIDAVARKLPGVLGHAESADSDSFAAGKGLEGPLFTRPQIWQNEIVPPILLSGDHKKIARWRKNISD
ncbi:MAG: tRNA (guanosine(37)-N1)-methyltransferase TrmD, partial [Bdellovibrionales bacterium]